MVHDDAQRLCHVVVIVERLAHPHHDDIREHAPLFRRRPFAQSVARQQQLADDFAWLQIADQALRAGVAKAAGQGAADLAGDAERATLRIGDVDAFGLLAVGEAQQPLAGPVGGGLRPADRRPARTCIGVTGLARDALVEIDFIARRP